MIYNDCLFRKIGCEEKDCMDCINYIKIGDRY